MHSSIAVSCRGVAAIVSSREKASDLRHIPFFSPCSFHARQIVKEEGAALSPFEEVVAQVSVAASRWEKKLDASFFRA